MGTAAQRQTERENLRALIEANEAIHGKVTPAEIQLAREEIYGTAEDVDCRVSSD